MPTSNRQKMKLLYLMQTLLNKNGMIQSLELLAENIEHFKNPTVTLDY